MKFDPPLKPARLFKRYKRFLADVVLPDESMLTLHCPNTGSMKNCATPGSVVWYSDSGNPARKYPHTFELVETTPGVLAGINTGRANALVREALDRDQIPELAGYRELQAEVRYGQENSRIDFLLQGHPARPGENCYLEVKSVTLGAGSGLGLFPDAVTARGSRHLRELAAIRQQGHRAILFYCVQHTGIEQVRPADEIDPEYGRTLREAVAAGVEVIAWRAAIRIDEIRLWVPVPVILDPL
ncbi:MAG: DNA/RNA nuclease SfsA [Pseudohongiellaceae bacterium]